MISWPFVAHEISGPIAAEDAPTAGKSKVVAASFLKQVEKFRRKVVFFNKDVDLACLALPEPGRQVPDFLQRVRAFSVPGARSFSFHVEMTSDGDLVFPTQDMILRVNKSGIAEKLVSLSELTADEAGKRPEGLHIEELLGSSAAAPVLYVSLSNEPDHPPGVIYTPSGSYYLGRLDLKSRRLSLLPYNGEREQAALDCDDGLV
jgi:hypothetical protein